MCGIAGLLNARLGGQEARECALSMIRTLHHRGPDDQGVWADDGVALSQSRLAIVDLSEAGSQPMVSPDGRYILVFNGEIYNHLSVRSELESRGSNPTWRGHSDTETFLAVLSAFETGAALSKCTGMFAFALLDRKNGTLTLGRDRMGEKPLYYGWSDHGFVFGSELKALQALTGFSADIDRQALQLFMRLGYIPAPRTIYQNVRKLLPGCTITIHIDGIAGHLPEPAPYWSVEDAVRQGVNSDMTDEDALEELESLLNSAVRQQMVADVPLGTFLSGGYDSSLVTALMQANSSSAIRTFTIGFHEGHYNEAEHARQIAKHLGTNHTEHYVDAAETLNVVPDLPYLFDEPFADSSQIPTFLVSKLARQDVTVSLSGDGGDELFGGYNRYFWATRMWRSFGSLPMALRTLAMGTVQSVSPDTWNQVFGAVRPVLPSSLRFNAPGDKLHKASGLLDARNAQDLYNRLISQWPPGSGVVLNANEPAYKPIGMAGLSSLETQMMFLDQTGYLPGDILTKVDRSAMGVSLETRVPLLDHRIVEFSWRLPLDKKIRDGKGKWLSRQLLYKHIPQHLVDRPKMGFAVPIDSWIRGPLKEWAHSLITPERIRDEGFLDPEIIGRHWDEHISGSRNWSYRLWNVLMFQAWLESRT